MTTSLLRTALALGCAAAFTFAAPAFAETVNLKAAMTAAGEVPPTQSKGKGELTATYDTASKKLAWKGTYSDRPGHRRALPRSGRGRQERRRRDPDLRRRRRQKPVRGLGHAHRRAGQGAP